MLVAAAGAAQEAAPKSAISAVKNRIIRFCNIAFTLFRFPPGLKAPLVSVAVQNIAPATMLRLRSRECEL